MDRGIQKVNKQTMVQQAIELLREYILNLDSDNMKLPSESLLAEKMGLSRLSIREAMVVLENEGLISRNQGSPTIVTSFARKLAENTDYTGELGSFIKECGFKLDVNLLSNTYEHPDEKTIEVFNMDEDDLVLTVKKSFLADGKPAAYCINRLPKDLFNEFEFNEECLGESMFDFVETNTNYIFSHDYMEFIPELVTSEIGNILSLTPASPILRVDVVKYATTGRVIMYNTEYYTDSLIRFSALRNNYGSRISKLSSSDTALGSNNHKR